jgi:hypothetical protein
MKSTPGQGSTFWFEVELPVGRLSTAPASADAPTSAPIRPVHVLIAEDNSINQMLFGARPATRAPRNLRQQRFASPRSCSGDELRLHSDGHADARDGRHRSDPRDPRRRRPECGRSHHCTERRRSARASPLL